MGCTQSQEDNIDITVEGTVSSFEANYKLKAVLGSGAFSTVREGVCKTTGDVHAIKIVTKKNLSEEDDLALQDEVDILRKMAHPNIVELYNFFDEHSYYYLALENMTGGELFDRIVVKKYYNEGDARDLIIILLEAMNYLHTNKVAHRDLKPENLLLRSVDDDALIKIADFGFAKRVTSKKLTTQCGTPGYVAPEILEGVPYDESADMWSVGVILYILLGGYPPFSEDNQAKLFKKIKSGKYEFHAEYWSQISTDAKDLVSSLLTVDSSKRATAADCLKHSWCIADSKRLSSVDLGSNLAELKRFQARRKLKGAIHTVMAMNKLKSLGAGFNLQRAQND